MTLLSLIFSLLLEQVRPASKPRVFPFDVFLRYADAVARNFNGGQQRHGLLAWIVAVGPWVLLADLGFWFFTELGGLPGSWQRVMLGLAWNVAVLHFTMGLREVSNGFSTVHDALRDGRLDDARGQVQQWSDGPVDEYTPDDLAKATIELGITRSHRQLFGVLAWFAVLPALLGSILPGALGVLLGGPGGAVLYRLATLLDERWGRTEDDAFREFGHSARTIAWWLDWVPVRLTAISFAIVGDFEDAVMCWRSQAQAWVDGQIGIALASGAGALGVRLGETLHRGGTVVMRPELGLGDDVDHEHLNSAVGLVWRALVLWILVVALMTVASWVS